jgi:hypothetical protein
MMPDRTVDKDQHKNTAQSAVEIDLLRTRSLIPIALIMLILMAAIDCLVRFFAG